MTPFKLKRRTIFLIVLFNTSTQTLAKEQAEKLSLLHPFKPFLEQNLSYESFDIRVLTGPAAGCYRIILKPGKTAPSAGLKEKIINPKVALTSQINCDTFIPYPP